MATGTLIPWFEEQFCDDNGDPLSGGTVLTQLAGTTTNTPTYTTAALTVANANPVVLNSAGRPASGGTEVGIFLVTGVSYKFTLKNSAGVTIRTIDNIVAVPISSGNTEFDGVAGETILANSAVYLSDGSGGKVAGLWYLTDADFTYASSLAAEVGIAPNAIAAGATGTIRTAGRVDGFSGLVVGTSYYVSVTAGEIRATIYTNVRFVGQADTTTSIILGPNPIPPASATDNSTVQGRLTLTSGLPVTTADVTGATTVYFAPYGGNKIALYDGTSRWDHVTFTEVSIALGTLTSGLPYDVFGYSNSGTLTLELNAWRLSGQAVTGATNASPIVITSNAHGLSNGDQVYISNVQGNTAANGTWVVASVAANTFALTGSTGNGAYTASTGWASGRQSGGLTTQNSVLVKSGTTTRRYLGTLYTTSTTQTEDSAAKRLLFNYYNRVSRPMRRLESTDSWAYTLLTWRQANASAANQLAVMQGWAESSITAMVNAESDNSGTIARSVAIGEDSTTAPSPLALYSNLNTGLSRANHTAWLSTIPATGYHVYVWLEISEAANTSTWYGDVVTAAILSQSHGMQGTCWC